MNVPGFSEFDLTWIIPVVGGVIALLAFCLGRRFFRPPSAPSRNELDEAERCLAGVNSDRRAALRRTGNTVEVWVSAGSDVPIRCGWVLDRSVGGLRLLLPDPVPVGALLQVRPRNAPDSLPWTAILVRSCRAEGAKWELGCQFQENPTYNVLLLFG